MELLLTNRASSPLNSTLAGLLLVCAFAIAATSCRTQDRTTPEDTSSARNDNIEWAWPGDGAPAMLVRVSLPPSPLSTWQTADGPTLVEVGQIEGMIILTHAAEMRAANRYQVVREDPLPQASAKNYLPLDVGRRWSYERLVYSYWALPLEGTADSEAVGYALFWRSGLKADGSWVDSRGLLKVVSSAVPGQRLTHWRFGPKRPDVTFYTRGGSGPPPTDWVPVRQSKYAVELREPTVVAGRQWFPVVTEPSIEAGHPPVRNWSVLEGKTGFEFWEQWFWEFPVANIEEEPTKGGSTGPYAPPTAGTQGGQVPDITVKSEKLILFDAGFSRVRTYSSSNRVNHGYIVEIEPQTVEVPAGSYEKTLRVIEYVEPRAPRSSPLSIPTAAPGQEFDQGWMTISWFAQGVGMVRQLQYAKNGRLCYETRLVRAEPGSAP